KEIELGLGIDHYQPVGLGHLRGNFCEVLGARHANRDRETQFRPHAAANRCCYFGWRPEEMDRARDIGKSLVHRDPLDDGREITQSLYGGVPEPWVALEPAFEKGELRTKLARQPTRHPAADPESLGLIRSGKHTPAANRNRPATQRRVEKLLDRGV